MKLSCEYACEGGMESRVEDVVIKDDPYRGVMGETSRLSGSSQAKSIKVVLAEKC